MRKGRRLPLDVLAPYLLNLPSPLAPPLWHGLLTVPRSGDRGTTGMSRGAGPARLDWPAIFGNSNPIEMEVGFGKGLFLLTAGQANPHINYVGIEIDRGLQLYTANRIAKRDLKNVRLVKTDVRFFIRDYVAPESMQAIHVYFPDPWWKKRHKKRRVFSESFVRDCERVLNPGGQLHIATDVEEYFGVMTQLIQEHTRLRPATDAALHERDSDYLTNFERKARLRGQPIWRAVYQIATRII